MSFGSPVIDDHGQTPTVAPSPGAVVLDSHLRYCAIRNNDDIVRAVPEVRGTPIHFNHLAFGPTV